MAWVSFNVEKPDIGNRAFLFAHCNVHLDFLDVLDVDPLVMAVPAIEGYDGIAVPIDGAVEKYRSFAFVATTVAMHAGYAFRNFGLNRQTFSINQLWNYLVVAPLFKLNRINVNLP